MLSQIGNPKGTAPVSFRRGARGSHSVAKQASFYVAFRLILGVKNEIKSMKVELFFAYVLSMHFEWQKHRLLDLPKAEKHRFYCSKTTIFQKWT